jgi:hypothetical protein
MKRLFFYFAVVIFTLTIYSCGSSIPQHCPSYSRSYSKIKHRKTKGINKNVFANGIKAPRKNTWRY